MFNGVCIPKELVPELEKAERECLAQPGGRIVDGKCITNGDARDVVSGTCAYAIKQCEEQGKSSGYNSPECQYAVKCQNPGYQGPNPGGYSGNQTPSGYGQQQQPHGQNPYGQQNPYGMSPQDRQFLEQQCFQQGNSQACAALQRNCAQQSQGTGSSGFGQLFGGQSGQQCGAAYSDAINSGICRQYQGTQYANGKCECPQGGAWDGRQCQSSEVVCAKYPGTQLKDNKCECPSRQVWNGAQCVTTAPGATTTPPTQELLTAELSCSPDVADVDKTPIAVSWLCKNASTSKGDGFNTNGETSGSATITLKSADINKDAERVDLVLSCSKDGNKQEDFCPVAVNRPLIVAVANPDKVVRGSKATIGWISKGMRDGSACTIKSSAHPDFSETGKTAVVTTPPIEYLTEFTIRCATRGGSTMEARIVVDVQ